MKFRFPKNINMYLDHNEHLHSKVYLCTGVAHNEHNAYYQKIEDYIGQTDRFDWPNEFEKELAIEMNNIWTLQWYPKTPVGFCCVAAASLKECLRFAMEDK